MHWSKTSFLLGSDDLSAKLWDVRTGQCVYGIQTHTCATVKFDEQKLVTGSFDNTIACWEWSTGAKIQQFRGHTGAGWCQILQKVFPANGTKRLTLIVVFAYDYCFISAVLHGCVIASWHSVCIILTFCFFFFYSIQHRLQRWVGHPGQWLSRLHCKSLVPVFRDLCQHFYWTHWVGHQGKTRDQFSLWKIVVYYL